eukprot:UN2169
MLCTATTCPQTNPGLYYALKYAVILGVVANCLRFVVWYALYFGVRVWVIEFVGRMERRQGCQEAVHRLPRVSAGSPELIDAEDGKVIDCTICLSTFRSDSVIVKAPCQHMFHEECLMGWCKNHSTCPLCRQQVGEHDP